MTACNVLYSALPDCHHSWHAKHCTRIADMDLGLRIFLPCTPPES